MPRVVFGLLRYVLARLGCVWEGVSGAALDYIKIFLFFGLVRLRDRSSSRLARTWLTVHGKRQRPSRSLTRRRLDRVLSACPITSAWAACKALGVAAVRIPCGALDGFQGHCGASWAHPDCDGSLACRVFRSHLGSGYEVSWTAGTGYIRLLLRSLSGVADARDGPDLSVRGQRREWLGKR